MYMYEINAQLMESLENILFLLISVSVSATLKQVDKGYKEIASDFQP